MLLKLMFNFAFKRWKPPSAQLQLKFEELLFLCNNLTTQIPELEVGDSIYERCLCICDTVSMLLTIIAEKD